MELPNNSNASATPQRDIVENALDPGTQLAYIMHSTSFIHSDKNFAVNFQGTRGTKYVLFATVLSFGVCFMFYASQSQGTLKVQHYYPMITTGRCINFLTSLQGTVTVMILDPTVIEKCGITSGKKILAAVDQRFLTNESLALLNDKFDILPMDRAQKDYFAIFDHGVKRIMPKFEYFQTGSIQAPVNPAQFAMHWKSSRQIDCLKMKVKRRPKDRKRKIPLKAIDRIAEIRDALYSMGTRPFLFGGSMLGWYRECTIIPHTTDFDLAILSTEFTENIEEYWKPRNPEETVALHRILGFLNESYEVTLITDYNFNVDIFSVYNDTQRGINSSYVSGIDGNLQKYHYLYPRIDELCSAILHEKHFFVPCNIQEVIEADYGPKWFKDFSSRHYTWNQSGKNIRKAGYYPKSLKRFINRYFRYTVK